MVHSGWNGAKIYDAVLRGRCAVERIYTFNLRGPQAVGLVGSP
jgi:hypothetical protein